MCLFLVNYHILIIYDYSNLLIYDSGKLFEILKEIEKEINYKVVKISEKDLFKIVENFDEIIF